MANNELLDKLDEIAPETKLNETSEINEISETQQTIQTLISECEKLNKRAEEAEKTLEAEREHKAALMDKMLRHHLDPNETRTKPHEEDIKEFARSVFGSRPFKKEYTLKGGNVVVLSALTDKEGEIITKITAEAAKELKDTESVLANLAVYKLKMLWHIRAVNDDKYEFPMGLETYRDALEEIEERFGGKPDSYFGIMIRIVDTHSTLMNLLAVHMFDEDFYKGAGLL